MGLCSFCPLPACCLLYCTNWWCIIFVSGLGPPRYTEPNMLKKSFKVWPASHSLILRCSATGTPHLNYTWLKNGEKIKRRRMDPYLNTTLWYLKLKDLVLDDSGKYTCIVSNPYGSINHTYTLRVVGEYFQEVCLMLYIWHKLKMSKIIISRSIVDDQIINVSESK